MRGSALVAAVLVATSVPTFGAIASADQPSLVAASAGPEDDGLGARHHEFRFDAGLMSALGLGGVSYTYAPLPIVELETGVGYGFTGLQLSFMVKSAIGPEHNRFVTGVGFAAGLPIFGSFLNDRATAYWINADFVGYEHRWSNGVAFSLALGAAVGLGNATYCFPDCGGGEYVDHLMGLVVPQGRMGVGYWF